MGYFTFIWQHRAKKSMKERELKTYDGFYYYCHPLKYSIFHNNHSCSMENTLRLHFPHNNDVDAGSSSVAEAPAPITFPLHPSPWICPHMAHIPACLAVVCFCCCLFSQPKVWGKGVVCSKLSVLLL